MASKAISFTNWLSVILGDAHLNHSGQIKIGFSMFHTSLFNSSLEQNSLHVSHTSVKCLLLVQN